MKNIKLNMYKPSMGILIDVRDKNSFSNFHYNGSLNIPYNELIFNHKQYLNKNDTYFIICQNGTLSKKATNILSVYGYNVVNVIK